MNAITHRRGAVHVHPRRPDVVVERTPEGLLNFHRVCSRHQRAELYVTDLRDIGGCPWCIAEFDEEAGRRRYIALQAALTGSL